MTGELATCGIARMDWRYARSVRRFLSRDSGPGASGSAPSNVGAEPGVGDAFPLGVLLPDGVGLEP